MLKSKRKRKELFDTVLYTLPAIILVTMMMYIPFIMSGYYSLTRWNGIAKDAEFIGLDNFITIFSKSKEFSSALIFTGKYTLLFIIFSNVLALFLAENDSIFVLVPPEKAGNEKGVYLTQKDVREVQLAKAAIAAGIQLLMKELGITEKEIQKIYIAGAFGNYMNPASACAIGLLPPELEHLVEPVGNAAGEGAKIALLNTDELEATDRLVRGIRFLELAASAEFQDTFVDELAFPEEE